MIDKRYPPCSIEAEEALIGCILLNSEALNSVKLWLPPEAFFATAHRTIYQAMLYLDSKKLPFDFISLTTYLSDQKKLNDIGGTASLSKLLNRTISATNSDRYGLIVLEKYQRRQLISLGAFISDLGYEQSEDLEAIYDKIRGMLPEKIMATSQPKSEPTITKAKYTVYSSSRLHKIELEADVADDENLADNIATVKAKAQLIGETLWNENIATKSMY